MIVKTQMQAKKAEMDAALEKYKALETEWVDLRIAYEMQSFKEKGILPGTTIRFEPFRKKSEGIFIGVERSQASSCTSLVVSVQVVLKSGEKSIFRLPDYRFDNIRPASPIGE